jgi:hypothetical protein
VIKNSKENELRRCDCAERVIVEKLLKRKLRFLLDKWRDEAKSKNEGNEKIRSRRRR